MFDAAGGSFKLCHFETSGFLALESGAEYIDGIGVVVAFSGDSGIVWYVDETTGALKTQTNHLCLGEREGSLNVLFMDIVLYIHLVGYNSVADYTGLSLFV